MLSKSLVKLGNWNPQLFREIKGRLKVRNVAIAIFASLFCQFIVMMIFMAQLPNFSSDRFHRSYCIKEKASTFYCSVIDWSHWWLDIFNTFSWILFALILIGGVYMLVADLAKEARLGTLNFIRLSPQSSHNILLGKLLGVPILIYLAAAFFLPLHLWVINSSNLSLFWIFAFYGILITACLFFYNASLLFVFLGGTQAWFAATIAGIFLLPIMGSGHSYIYNGVISITGIKHSGIVGFIMFSFAFWSSWIWQAVNRRYRNPNATVISKKQSYFLVGCFQVYLLLFFLGNIAESETYMLQESLYCFCTINLFWFLLVIAILSPQRQTLQDWARYRHLQVNNNENAIVKGLTIGLKQDLIWGEKSPALVAIAINLVITAVIWISWILLWNNNEIKLSAILALILGLNLILIYAAIAQLILLIKTQKPTLWVAAILGGLIALPPLVLSLFSMTAYKFPILWLLSTFPWLFLQAEYTTITSMLITIIAQWSILILVTLALTQKIKKLGESNSQKLLTSQHK